MIQGIGIGFRRDLASDLIGLEKDLPDFIEFAPENWMGLGGFWHKKLEEAATKFPIVCHGLSLSIGSPDPLDLRFIKDLKKFLDRYDVSLYSEHLSYSKCANAHLYDLLPIPFRKDAVDHIVQRIQQVQELLQRELILENVSYYTPVAAEMEEHEFISSIAERSGCKLLLDVNNVYVNAFNHQYDAKDFILKMPLKQVAYIHMAGHEKIQEDLIIDTHGEAIIDPVYDLFEWTLQHLNPVPVLLERDFNIPELNELQVEMKKLRSIAATNWKMSHVT
jgi:uncharacterized protein (UPF0276 family)